MKETRVYLFAHSYLVFKYCYVMQTFNLTSVICLPIGLEPIKWFCVKSKALVCWDVKCSWCILLLQLTGLIYSNSFFFFFFWPYKIVDLLVFDKHINSFGLINAKLYIWFIFKRVLRTTLLAHSIKWFQVFLSNTNNYFIFIFVCTLSNNFKNFYS